MPATAAGFRPTWAEISPSAFVSNLEAVRRRVGPDVAVMAVLKADAYGHGAPLLAEAAISAGARSIGVSSLDEAVALRDAGFDGAVFLLGGMYPFSHLPVALDRAIMPTVASWEAARHLNAIAMSRNATVPFHLKVDTGMGRIGVSVEEAVRMLGWLSHAPALRLAGVYTHLSCADTDADVSAEQLRRFSHVQSAVAKSGFADVVFHVANSAAVFGLSASHCDMVRPGLALFGVPPKGCPEPLVPVLAWKTRIIFLKRVPPGTAISYGRTFVTKEATTIATLPVGYADGVPRSVSNRGAVLVRGRRCRIVGTVTMDHIMVDVGGLPEADVGDEVVLIGRQGEETLTAADWADWAGTIPYEILCGISRRVPRVRV